MHKHLRVSIALVLAAASLGGLWFGQQKATEKPVAKAAGPVPVLLAQAKAGEMPVLLNVVGRAEAYEGVTLKSRIDGQVLAVDYTEGRAVKAGEVLLRLDPADWQAKAAQAEAVVARDQAQWAKAQADLERYIGLKAKGFVSDEKVNEVRTNVAAAAATLKADQAALELARLQLSYTVIRAPFAGVVGARLVFPGSAVKTNDTALAVVNRVHPLFVTFTVPERHLPLLRGAMKAGAMPVQVSLPGSKSALLEGKAKFIDNAVDVATGTIQMKAVVDNRDGQLTPGQFLNISMVLETLRAAVLIPNEAVQQGNDGNFLYVAKQDETVEVRKIQVLTTHRGYSAIGQGLAAGETVVTDGQLRLTPGARIRARSEQAEKVTENQGKPAEPPAVAK